MEAASLFASRTWADLQYLAEQVTRSFHRVSGLPVLAGYAWRVALDRKNDQVPQGQLYFVFDGPATSEHLDQLEAAVHIADLGFGPATVERVPLTGAPTVLADDGRVFAVWSADPVDLAAGDDPSTAPEPWCRQLVWTPDGHIAPRVLLKSRATPTDEAPGLVSILGVIPPYTEAEQQAERLRLAFAQRIVEQILVATSPMNADKRRFLDHLFPADLLGRLDLAEPAVADEYFDAACEWLPSALGYHDKLALVGVFFSACCRDGALDAREMRVLREGGEMLGLTREQVVKYLRRFW